MATKKRTTKPLSPEARALRAAATQARETGQSQTAAAYKAMSAEGKRAFIKTHAA